jgi:hypothetical protein
MPLIFKASKNKNKEQYDFSKQLQTIRKFTLQKPQHLFILKPTPFAPLEATNSFWALSITTSHLHTNQFF